MTSVATVDLIKPGLTVVSITDLRKCSRPIAGTVWDSLVNGGWEGVMNESGWVHASTGHMLSSRQALATQSPNKHCKARP
jgi:hypothetical protein